MRTKKLLSYYNNPALKEQLIAQLQAHYDADEIVQGVYDWENGRGGAVGCTVHSHDRWLYECLWGIPMEIAELQDAIFENLSPAEAKEFPLQFARAIPVGSDLSLVTSRFLLCLFEDIRRIAEREDALSETDRIIVLYGRRLVGDEPKAEEWEAVAGQCPEILGVCSSVVRWADLAAQWATRRAMLIGAAAQRDCLLRLLAEAQ